MVELILEAGSYQAMQKIMTDITAGRIDKKQAAYLGIPKGECFYRFSANDYPSTERLREELRRALKIPEPAPTKHPLFDEAYKALRSMGFKAAEAKNALLKIEPTNVGQDVPTLIRYALQILSKTKS